MSEKTITRKISEELRERGWWVIKIHGSPYQRRGLPDLLCITPDGDVRFIEVKQPGRRPTALQAATILALKQRGVRTIVATCIEDLFEEWGYL